jgi:hypothetical protein
MQCEEETKGKVHTTSKGENGAIKYVVVSLYLLDALRHTCTQNYKHTELILIGKMFGTVNVSQQRTAPLVNYICMHNLLLLAQGLL